MAGPDVPDSDLIAAMRERDEGALRTLYERHAGWMSARLMRRCADRDVVADALQDTFVSAWNGAAKFPWRRGGRRLALGDRGTP
jgi:RNA polymerase sigma-70 factor (ECF subfamily)